MFSFLHNDLNSELNVNFSCVQMLPQLNCQIVVLQEQAGRLDYGLIP